MADYKDYIVRYDIQADVTKAAEGLQSIANIAKEFEVPMRELSAAIKQVSQSASQLKQNANITFAPKIDVGAFNNQLRNMVIQVRDAAAEMHAALFEALSGNTSATKAMQKGISTALGNHKSIKDLKSDIAAYNKELDKLLGTPVTKKGKTTRNRDGAIQMAKNANLHDKVASLEGQKKMFRDLIRQRTAELEAAEKLEREASATAVKTDSKAKSKVTGSSLPKSQPAKLTNVTPAVIREWKKAFGDAKSKSLTVNIRGNADGPNGALTIIRQVQSSLESLQATGSFNIVPVLNMEAFAAAEAQLKRLAGLVSSVTAPFIAKDERSQGSKLGSPVTSLTKDEKSKLSEAKKQIKAWNDKIAGIQSRLDANKAKYEQAPTPGLKGQITRDTKTLEKYQANRAVHEDVVKNLQGKTATAVQSSTKGIKPLSVDVIGNLKGINIAGKTPVVPIIGELTKIQGKIAEAIPVNVKIMADQVAASIKSIPTPTLNVNVRLNTEGIAQQLQTAATKTKSVTKTETKTEPVPVKGIGVKSKAQPPKNTALITGDIDTKNIINQIKNIPRQTIPVAVKLMWEKGAVGRQEQLKNLATKIPPVTITLDTKAAVAKFEEFIALIKSNSVQNIRLTASGNASNITASTSSASVISGGIGKTGGNVKVPAGNKELTPQERYAKLKDDAVKRAQKAKAGGNQMLLKGNEVRAKEQAWYTQQQAMYNRLFEAVPKPDYGWLKRAEEQRASELATMREDAKAAFAKPTPFERKEIAAHNANVSNSIAGHQQRATRLRSQAYNSMLPFAQNKEQANMMVKHRKYFRQAVSTTGIMPTQGMEATQMLKYLQGVSGQMQSASVAVPWQLQNQINKLKTQIEGARGSIGGGTVGRMPLTPVSGQQSTADRLRRWTYPLTGNTSFGARTPMAVDMAKGMGVMYAIGGAMSAIGNSFGQAMEYQNTMQTTKAILQHGTDSYSNGSFKNMEAIVRDVGVKTKFSAPEVADAVKFLAMAGYDINAINAAIRPIADLALIGDSDLGETADKMTNIMTTFQIAPEKMREAANIMATTATRSNTDLMMLAESAKYGGGVANMYGRKDPNLFADTMALFGVMGNAGVQASSAGTALRMMYQNIFKPNKNQKAVLDMMKKTYGITTVKEDGSYRSMSDILIEMAQRIPENKMAEIVGNLFRITAQPGATAALLAAAGGDTNTAQEIGAGIDAMANKMSSKAGLSSLVSLMLANRASMNGNISGGIAEEKQNTIKGLWAQVTSTFTEGILQAFEQRQEQFEDILKDLKDYFAKPETMKMLQDLLGLIIEVGKVMAGFAKVWAKIYSMAPSLVKLWVTAQMFFTQMGALTAPIVGLTSALSGLRGAFTGLLGISGTAGTALASNVAGTATTAGTSLAGGIAGSSTSRVAGASLAGAAVTRAVASASGSAAVRNAVINGATAAMAAQTFVGRGFFGTKKYVRGNITERANREYLNNILLAEGNRHTRERLDKNTAEHYNAVRKRALRMYYGPKRAFYRARHAVPTMATFAPIINGIKNLFMSLVGGLAGPLGFLLNPITMVTGAIAGLGFGVYKCIQYINGNTARQIEAQQQMAKLSSESFQFMLQNMQWYKDELDKFKHKPVLINLPGKSEKQLENEKKANQFRGQISEIIGYDTADKSEKGLGKVVDSMLKKTNENPLWQLALNGEEKFSRDNLLYEPVTWSYSPSNIGYTFDFRDNRGVDMYSVLNRLFQMSVRTAAADDPAVKIAGGQIKELREKFLNKEISKDEYDTQTRKIYDSFVNLNYPALPKNMKPEEMGDISDPAKFLEYHIGLASIINGFINGNAGTVTAKLNAYNDLKNKVEVGSESWWNAIGNVISDFPAILNTVLPDGKQLVNFKLQLSMLPDNKTIDANAMVSKIRDKIEGFNMTLRDCIAIYLSIYQELAESFPELNNADTARKWLSHQIQHLPVTPEDAAAYWNDNIPDNAALKAGGRQVDTFKKFIADQNGNLTVNGKTIPASGYRVLIRNTWANQAIDSMFKGVPFFNGSGPLLPGVQNNDSNNTNNTPTQNTTNQNEYASKYESSAARPTQINIHINELAHFDRTTVASSAEERDLVESMESRIAEAVYRIFAEASNHAQSTIDLT